MERNGTLRIKFDSRLLDMCLHAISWRDGSLQRSHYRHGRHDLVLALIPQHLQHREVIHLTPRLFEYPAVMRNNDSVCSDYDAGFATLLVVHLGLVDIVRFGRCRLQDIVERAEVVWEVLGKLGGTYVDIGEAELVLVSMRRCSWRNALLACASSCLRRGEAEASTTLLLRNSFRHGRFNGGGGPGGGLLAPGVPGVDRSCVAGDFRASS